MEKDKLKLELVQRILECDDLEILKKVETVLHNYPEVNEAGESYSKDIAEIPASHYQKLDEEFDKYKNGEQQGASWKDVRKEIKEKHGF